jgi:hypothetical protein
MKIKEFIRKMFLPKSDEQVMLCELRAANRERVQAMKAIEYAASLLQYHKARIEILEAELALRKKQ